MDVESFPTINRAYNAAFKPGRLTLGLVLPLESYAVGDVPSMARHTERVQLAEQLNVHAAGAATVLCVPIDPRGHVCSALGLALQHGARHRIPVSLLTHGQLDDSILDLVQDLYAALAWRTGGVSGGTLA